MTTVVPSVIPAVVAARVRRIQHQFLAAQADAAERARTPDELGVDAGHLFRRQVAAGVLVPLGDGRYWLSREALARWQRRRRIGIAAALTALATGTLVALLL